MSPPGSKGWPKRGEHLRLAGRARSPTPSHGGMAFDDLGEQLRQDTLETAGAFGLSTRPSWRSGDELDASVDFDPYRARRHVDRLIEGWLPLAIALNSLNRAMGQPCPTSILSCSRPRRSKSWPSFTSSSMPSELPGRPLCAAGGPPREAMKISISPDRSGATGVSAASPPSPLSARPRSWRSISARRC